jgi:hypothetical protein
MNDNADLRYETKFVLGRRQTPAFVAWLHSLPRLRVTFPKRFVNTLYFDTFAFECVRDNIVGLPRRRKFRLRWYHRETATGGYGVQFEIKSRENRAGYKELFPVPISVGELLEFDLKSIGRLIDKAVPYSAQVPSEVFHNPVVHVLYYRNYFEVEPGIRVTLDTEVQVFGLQASSRLYQRKPTSYSRNVVEIKYDLKDRERVSRLLARGNMSPVRHSKYLAGMAALGYTVYL